MAGKGIVKKKKAIRQTITSGTGKGLARFNMANRKHFSLLRDALHVYEDTVGIYPRRKTRPYGKNYKLLYKRAGEAIDRLGGQAEPACVSLKDYDYRRYGPFLGVSDEGSAAACIRDAALSSPKMLAIGNAPPIVAGVSHDAERLAAVGEVAVGPCEYRQIRLECMGRILTSTNVGTRLNLRYYKRYPVIKIEAGHLKASLEKAEKSAKEIIEPFWHTPDNRPRPITVFVRFMSSVRVKSRLLKALAKAFKKGEFCDPEYHKLGLLVNVKSREKGLKTARAAVDMAKSAGLTEVIVSGRIHKEAEDKISMPGLLNYFSPEHTAILLRYAAKKRISLNLRNRIDPDTVARNVWSGLCVARNMGLELGKYGLFPLTLTESSQVMKMVQRWFSSWTAAPVFYVDFPTTDSSRVYTEKNITKGIREWLKIVSKHKIPVVLIDTADKDKGRRLLKNSPGDKVGILLLEQIARINAFAKKLGISVLWAGGITLAQVFKMGRLGIFGIYVTSAAAIARPVGERYERDPMLSREKEPTFHGVYRVKLLLEAGFLAEGLKRYDHKELADTIERKAGEFLAILKRNYEKEAVKRKQDELISLTLKAWRIHLRYS
ncbi:hypothetical protein KAW55_03600 [bacterium]|nr:hypothetical protein [bacterium]